MQQPLYGSQPHTQATTATSHPESIATAPLPRCREPLRPMLLRACWMPQTEQPGEAPIQVVGSQSRRGILPSAPGHPVAPAAGTDVGKNTAIPVKDADGKFPCPHRTKTYLHAKHLKRNLLRHTGNRPYMCVLCRDTFSRSDILKRHFQKCSIRRGNPTGATHLSNSLDHAGGNQKPARGEGDMYHVNGMNDMRPFEGMVRPGNMGHVSDGMDMFNYQPTGSSSMGNGDTPDRRSMPGPGMGSYQPYPSDVSNSMDSQQRPYFMPYGQSWWPMYGGSNANQQSSLDLSQMFQASAHQT